MNSVVQLARNNFHSRYRFFKCCRSLICLLFFYKSSIRFLHSHGPAIFLVFQSSRCLDGLHFCLVLASAALWVGVETASPPISYLVFLSRLASAHWFYFSFISFSPTPWIFGFSGFSDVSDMEILEDSALEGSFLCLLPCKLLGLLRPISSGVSALVAGFLIFFARLSGCSRALARPLVCCDERVSEYLPIGPLCDFKNIPWKFSPCLLFSSSHDGEGLNALFPSLRCAKLLYPSFLMLFEEDRIKWC